MVNPWSNYNGLTDSSPDAPEGGGGTQGGGNDPGPPNTPCAPGYTKQFKPDGSFECVAPSAGDCPEGQEKSPYNSSGGDASYPLECVSHEEAQRRFDARKQQNGEATPASGGGSTGTYKPPTAKPTKSPYDDAMSKTLFETLTNMINGGDAPFSADTIGKLQAAALQSNKGQLSNSRGELQKRLINSGLSRSGVAPSSYQKLESAANVDLSNNLRTVATTAVQKNYEARVTALNQAQAFLQSERANALSQDQLILAYARLKQEWATTQSGYDQQWKIVQNGDEQSLMRMLLCLKTPGCQL